MKESIKKRIAAVRRGEVPDGYRVENGYLIPDDWKTVPLKSRFSRSTRKNSTECENVLTISAQMGLVNQREFYDKDIASEDKSGYFLMKNGEFAYNKSYSTGYPYGAIKQLTKYDEGVVSPLYICFAPKAGTNTAFYTQYFEGSRYNREIYRFAQEGARNHGLLNIAVEDFFTGTLVEPSPGEQQKIAEILATCDKLIELKQKLLEEKRRQKWWLMEKLLDPDSGVRLPGFDDSEWRKIKIEKLGDIITGSTPSRGNADNWNGPFPWISAQDFHGKYISKTEEYVTETGLKQCRVLPKGAVLVTCIASIGLNAITTEECATNQQINAIVCSQKFDSEFVFYAIENIGEYLQKIAGKTAVPIISKGVFSKIEINVPASKREQSAVAEVLALLDNAIELHEKESDELCQKKKALMQLLLTGLVRVNA